MARAHDDAREHDNDGEGEEQQTERDPREPTQEEQAAAGAVVLRLVRLDAALRAGSPSLGREPGDGLAGALEELLERHTMHRKA